MKRFERLMRSESERERPRGAAPSSITLGRFRSRELRFRYEGPYTESKYTCLNITCGGEDCEENVMYVVEPTYDLEVGITMSVPIELLFSDKEPVLEEGDVEFWSQHVLATDKKYVIKCDCGHTNEYVLAKDGGLIVLTTGYKRINVPIPANRIRYVSRPKSEWESCVT